LVLRTTFGFVVSRDGGGSWRWICETAVGYQDIEPGIGVADGGAILAAIGPGVSRGSSDACDFGLTLEAGSFGMDLSVQRDAPLRVVAVLHRADVMGSEVWQSIDGGARWSPVSGALPSGFFASTTDIARSEPERIYVAGMQDGAMPMLARSIDGGDSWTMLAISGLAAEVPYLAAVDPAGRVYVRSDGDPGRLLVSDDGGDSWSTPFMGTAPLRGFALSPDGSKVLIGDGTGIWRADATTLAFEKISDVLVECLTWAERGVYACANQSLSGFFVGLSADEGATFESLLSMYCIEGPLSCPPGTSVADTCPPLWPNVASQLLTWKCDGGGGGAQASSSSGAGGAGTGGASEPTGGDCSCRLGGGKGWGVGWGALGAGWAALGAVALALAGRRRFPKR
jgi:hypothetical protein